MGILPGLCVLFMFLGASNVVAQQTPLELIRYPEIIFHNANIVTADEKFSVAQAVAVRDGKVLAVGRARDILSLAGPETVKIDLKGKTVLPGLIDTHVHLHNYALYHWALQVAPQVAQHNIIEGRSLDEIFQSLREAIRKDVVGKVPPGEWVVYEIRGRPGDVSIRFAKRTTRFDLDRFLSDHPLLLMPENAEAIVNSRGLEALLKKYPREALDLDADKQGQPTGRLGHTAKFFVDELIPRERPEKLSAAYKMELLAAVYKKELEEWASYGITTWSSKMDAESLAAFALLDKRREMPIRLGYSIESFKNSPCGGEMAKYIGNTVGYGSPFLWMIGVSFTTDGSYPNACTTLPTEKKYLENCQLAPGSKQWNAAFAAVEQGFRISGTHAAGDLAVDHLLLLIEKASEAAGMSLEQIREKKHAIDHCSQNPRPDQIEKGKRLGVTWTCGPKYVHRAPYAAELYGREIIGKLVVPVKSMVSAGLRPAFHTDGHHAGPMVFQHMQTLMTRRDLEGNVWGADEMVDRKTVLLMATRWGAEYVLREKELGSIEPGKWADLIVIDRDYLAIPVEEISKIQILMTVVGGRPVHAQPAFASEIGWPKP